jgi:UDP-N-acetylmuramyl pentapeptide phosphotransferase/UDP-N-acetylglucosamine-1-phosphate transferase
LVFHPIGRNRLVSFAIIIVPLVDTLRVMTIRIYNKTSPFSPDNNHIHHRLLGLVSGHLKVTLIIITVNIAIIVFALFLNQLQINVNIQFILVLLAGIIFSLIPSVILKIKSAEELRSSEQLKQVG